MTANGRPGLPSDSPPAGYHYEAHPDLDPDWVLLDSPAGGEVGPGGCRWTAARMPNPRKACGAPAVAALDRAIGNLQFRSQRKRRWWRYCAEHLYGRWIEDGQLMRWRLIRDEQTESADA